MTPDNSGSVAAQISQFSVLVVDDSPEQTELARTVLVRGGLKVFCANSADDAMRVAASHSIDLAILDIFLDDGGLGKDLMLDLRQKYSGLSVMFVSGLGDGRELSEALSHPKTWFLKKPYRVAEFLSSVKAILESNCA